MSRLIFIDPSVLGAFISPVPTSVNPFDSNACEAFRDLLKRVDNAAIVILARCSPSLAVTQKIWEESGLFGNRIIDIIDSRGGICFLTHSVHNYLRKYGKFTEGEFELESFVIIDGMPCEDSYPDRLFEVKEHLTSENVESIVEILNRPFNTLFIDKRYLAPDRPQGNECVCS